jgi:ribonuclease PH
MESYKKSFKLGDKEITLESGKVARQATGAVIATCEDTQVLATVVVGKAPGEHQDFFPLTVNYQEKTYATGKIPGGFFKREGRPTEKETLTSRLIDRPLRPLFNDDFLYEVQVICTVISSDKNVDPDVLSFIAASAAVAISGLPFNGPLGAVRVGFIDGNYCVNPTRSELEDSHLDMVIAGSDAAVIMVESEAKELSEDQMLAPISSEPARLSDPARSGGLRTATCDGRDLRPRSSTVPGPTATGEPDRDRWTTRTQCRGTPKTRSATGYSRPPSRVRSRRRPGQGPDPAGQVQPGLGEGTK